MDTSFGEEFAPFSCDASRLEDEEDLSDQTIVRERKARKRLRTLLDEQSDINESLMEENSCLAAQQQSLLELLQDKDRQLGYFSTINKFETTSSTQGGIEIPAIINEDGAESVESVDERLKFKSIRYLNKRIHTKLKLALILWKLKADKVKISNEFDARRASFADFKIGLYKKVHSASINSIFTTIRFAHNRNMEDSFNILKKYGRTRIENDQTTHQALQKLQIVFNKRKSGILRSLVTNLRVEQLQMVESETLQSKFLLASYLLQRKTNDILASRFRKWGQSTKSLSYRDKKLISLFRAQNQKRLFQGFTLWSKTVSRMGENEKVSGFIKKITQISQFSKRFICLNSICVYWERNLNRVVLKKFIQWKTNQKLRQADDFEAPKGAKLAQILLVLDNRHSSVQYSFRTMVKHVSYKILMEGIMTMDKGRSMSTKLEAAYLCTKRQAFREIMTTAHTSQANERVSLENYKSSQEVLRKLLLTRRVQIMKAYLTKWNTHSSKQKYCEELEQKRELISNLKGKLAGKEKDVNKIRLELNVKSRESCDYQDKVEELQQIQLRTKEQLFLKERELTEMLIKYRALKDGSKREDRRVEVVNGDTCQQVIAEEDECESDGMSTARSFCEGESTEDHLTEPQMSNTSPILPKTNSSQKRSNMVAPFEDKLGSVDGLPNLDRAREIHGSLNDQENVLQPRNMDQEKNRGRKGSSVNMSIDSIKELNSLKNRNKESRGLIKNLENIIKTKNSQVEELKKVLEGKAMKLNELSTDLESRSKDKLMIEKLETQLEENTFAMQEIQQEIDSCKLQNQRELQIRTSLQEDNEKLLREKNETHAALSKLNSDLQQAFEENESLKTSALMWEGKFNQSQEDIQYMKENEERLRQEYTGNNTLLDELMTKNQELETKSNELKKEMKTKTSKLGQLESELQNYLDEIDMLHQERDRLTNEKRLADRRLNQTANSMARNEEFHLQQIEEMENALNEANTRSEKLLRDKEQFNKQFELVQKDIRVREAKVNEFHEVHKRIENELNTCKEKEKIKQNQIRVLEGENKSLREELNEFENQKIKIERAAGQVQKDMIQLQRRNQQLEMQVQQGEDSAGHNSQLVMENQRLEQERAAVASKLKKSNVEVSKLNARAEELQRAYEKLKFDNSQVANELISNNKDFSRTKLDHRSLQEKYKKLMNENLRIKSEMEATQGSLVKIRQENDKLMSSVSTGQSNVDQFAHEKRHLLEEIENLRGDNQRIVQQYNMLQGQLHQLREKTPATNELANENSGLMQKIDELRDENTRLGRDTQKLRQEKERTQQELSQSKNHMNLVKAELEECKNAAISSKQEVKRVFVEMDNYAKILEAMQTKMAQLEGEKTKAELERNEAIEEIKGIRQRYINMLSVNNQ
mmetsp:Transcript_23264/g.26395  ORF Transcript_23264/g.26395 Transcript_23264/m.26395 type:complete len:1389 (+) Transcript_23264:288-4454(+)